MGDELVLVTGGAGFIGSHTVDALLARGYRVRILDALQPRVHPAGRPAWLAADAEFLAGDVRDRRAWEEALRGARAVFHLAAYQDYLNDFSTFLEVNAVSTALLFELVAGRHPSAAQLERVVVASSQAVYGEGEYACPRCGARAAPGPRRLERLARGQWEHPCPACGADLEPLALTEETANPQTAYGISKFAAERLAVALGRRLGLAVVALRYSIVQGPRNSPVNAYSGVCRIFTRRLLAGRRPMIFEDGRQLRDYVHVDDVVAAHLVALEHPAAAGEVFNVGGREAVTVAEFARRLGLAVRRQTGGPEISPELPGVFRVGDPRHTVSSSAKLERLGWRAAHGLDRILADYVAWFRATIAAAGTPAELESVAAGTDRASEEMRRQGVLLDVREAAAPALGREARG